MNRRKTRFFSSGFLTIFILAMLLLIFPQEYALGQTPQPDPTPVAPEIIPPTAYPLADNEVEVKKGNQVSKYRPIKTTKTADGREAVSDRIIVGFVDGVDDNAKAEVHRKVAGGKKVGAAKAVGKVGVNNAQLVDVTGSSSLEEAIKEYMSESSVRYAEPDYMAYADLTPNDTYFSQMWGMTKIQAPQAWDITTGSSSVYVAVLDCGVYDTVSAPGSTGHPDINGKVVAAANFSDSTHGADDWCNHGTHVTGTVAANTNNGMGVAGVGFNTRIMNGKVLGDNGSGTSSWLINGINWASNNGAKVITMSLSGGGSCFSSLQDAVNYAWSRNVVVVAAAGNNGNTALNWPASCNNVVAVGSTDSNDIRSSFSNYGSSWVDVAAPGSSILSTNYTGGYSTFNGTSMATPHVAGLAALLWAVGYKTNTGIVNRIKSTTDTVAGSGSEWETGRINAYKAVQPAPSTANNLQFYPLSKPIRLLETRPGFSGYYTPNTPLVAGFDYTYTGRNLTYDGVNIPASAQVLVGNATVVNNTGAGGGFVTLYPGGDVRPNVSNLNYTAGQTIPNAFTVSLNSSGQFSIYATTGINFIIDITGYYAAPSSGLYYHPLPNPIRLLETRPGFSGHYTPGTPLPAGTDYNLVGRNLTYNGITIPNSAQVLVGNATVVNTTGAGAGWVILFPGGVSRPTVSNLNYTTGQIIPNAFTIGLGNNGSFNIYATTGINFLIDITGYYSNEATDVNGTGLLYSGLSWPVRLLETRPNFSGYYHPGAPLTGNTDNTYNGRNLTYTGISIPNSAKAIVGNATVINNTGAPAGWVTIYPGEGTLPTVSNLNYVAGQIIPNSFVVGLGATNGNFRIRPTGNIHFLVDIAGYFS
jgi:thermitase